MKSSVGELNRLVKKLVKSIYINNYMGDKDIFSKYMELKNINSKDIKVSYVVTSIINSDLINKLSNVNINLIIFEIKKYIEELNKKENLRLEEIINNEIISIKDLECAIDFISKIDDYYKYHDELKENLKKRKELIDFKRLIINKGLVNKDIEPIINLIAEEIEYINTLKKPKFYKIKKYLKYKSDLKYHKGRIEEYSQNGIDILIRDKRNFSHDYFYYEDSISDTITFIKEYLIKEDFIHIYSSLKNVYDTNVDGIKKCRKSVSKLEKNLKDNVVESNEYFELIDNIIKNKESRYLYFIANSLYRISNNLEKQELFNTILKILKLVYNVECGKNINFDNYDYVDYDVLFLKSLFSSNINEKVIVNNLDFYKKIIDLNKKNVEKDDVFTK